MRRYTVLQLTGELERLIAGRYPMVEVEGEISQLQVPASGHCYLTLRDGDAILGSVCWRETWRGMSFRPERGAKVVARGRLAVYGPKGAYQLYVHHLSPAGEGALAAELARRRARLEAEGLLDPRRKRPLPRLPRHVGVATSLTGAALQDFLKVSRERFPAARILVAGCQVQGPLAPPSVVQAVDLLLRDGRAEVIVVTRGGGSKEDLLAFQDEGLVRFLAHSPVPVVSAVGHQVDTTLADLVADAVAATPSAAAVCVLPDAFALAQRVDDVAVALQRCIDRGLQRRRQQVDGWRDRLRHPRERLVLARRRAVELEERARGALRVRLPVHRRDVARLQERLDRALAPRVPAGRVGVERLEERLARAMALQLQGARARLAGLAGTVEALSPQRVLARGFAVVVGPRGVVSSVEDAARGDLLTVRVQDGAIPAVVTAEPDEGPGGVRS